MPPDAPLPYPLAGADPKASEPIQGGPPTGETAVRRRRWLILGVPALVLVVALVGWLAIQRTADRALIDDLTQQRDQADAAAQMYRSALESAIDEPIEDRQAFGPEMVIASAAVGRFIDSQPAASAATAEQFATAFFGTEVRTTAWLTLPGRTSLVGVLARVDRPSEPGVVWVSRRSSITADPSVPARTNCLRLDVAAVVASVAAGRPYAAAADSAPLRWWADVYRFVPAAFCGAVSAE